MCHSERKPKAPGLEDSPSHSERSGRRPRSRGIALIPKEGKALYREACDFSTPPLRGSARNDKGSERNDNGRGMTMRLLVRRPDLPTLEVIHREVRHRADAR